MLTSNTFGRLRESLRRLVLPAGAASYARVSSGLIYRSDGSLTGWTGNDGTWSATSKAALIAGERSAIVAQTPGTGSASDAGGNREGFEFVDSDGIRYFTYGAGDGTTGSGGPWRPQASKSVDGGLTTVKLGPLSMGLTNGTGGTAWPSADNLFSEKRGGFYYLHRLTAGSVNNNVCGSPYSSDLWKVPVAQGFAGTYTYVGQTLAPSSASFESQDAYASCIYVENGTYYLFYSATGNGQWHIGLATSTNYEGPYTKTGSQVLPNAIKGQPENPEVSYSQTLGLYVMITNQVNTSAGLTDKNRVFFSNSVTDWSNATWCDIQRICPADGAYAIGLARMTRGPDNNPLYDTLGNFAMLYDTDPAPSGSGYHTLRKIRWSQVTPSKGGLTRTPAAATTSGSTSATSFSDDFSTETVGQLGGQNGWNDASGTNAKPSIALNSGVKNLEMGSNVGPSIVVQSTQFQDNDQTIVGNYGAGAGCGLIFCWNGLGSAFFHIDANGGSGSTASIVYVDASGNETTIGTAVSTTFPAETNVTFRAKLVGYTFTVYVNGTAVATQTITDAAQKALIDKGGLTGIRNGYAGGSHRTIKSYSVAGSASGALAVPAAVPIIRSLAHTDFVQEFSVQATVLAGTVDLFYRLQTTTATSDCYRVRLDLGGSNALGASLSKVVGGTVTALSAATSTRTVVAAVNFAHRVTISVQAGVHTLRVDGEAQLQVTDTTFTSGAGVGQLISNDATAILREATFYKAPSVTVSGVVAGQVVTLRGAGGVPLASTTATGTSVTLASAHYPAATIDVAGVQRYAPAGGIWGGDVYA